MHRFALHRVRDDNVEFALERGSSRAQDSLPRSRALIPGRVMRLPLSSSLGKMPRVAGASAAPEGPPFDGRTENGRFKRARPATCRHPFRSPERLALRLALADVGASRAPLRCATRTAGRNAGGFPGRHPGTAAGPLPRLLATTDSAGAGADHLPRRPAPVPGRRPSAGRDGRQCKGGFAGGDNRVSISPLRHPGAPRSERRPNSAKISQPPQMTRKSSPRSQDGQKRLSGSRLQSARITSSGGEVRPCLSWGKLPLLHGTT